MKKIINFICYISVAFELLCLVKYFNFLPFTVWQRAYYFINPRFHLEAYILPTLAILIFNFFAKRYFKGAKTLPDYASTLAIFLSFIHLLFFWKAVCSI
ncbi:MAG: hypothetical protein LUC92_05695 [Clostridiales bacterium]|nr:hypothetical protein [Clostridiales bacterium]